MRRHTYDVVPPTCPALKNILFELYLEVMALVERYKRGELVYEQLDAEIHDLIRDDGLKQIQNHVSLPLRAALDNAYGCGEIPDDALADRL